MLERIHTLLAEKIPRHRGRPKGTGEDDTHRLEKMAELLTAEETLSLRKAAQRVAQVDPGYSESATANRIRRKFSLDKRRLLQEARLRAALKSASPSEAARLLQDHLASAVEELDATPQRGEATATLKERLAHMVDEVRSTLDVGAVAESLEDPRRATDLTMDRRKRGLEE